MSKKPTKKLHLPLKNITASFNSGNMSYTGESAFSSLTNSPMTNLAFNLSELSTGRNTPRLRRKLSLSSVDTPPNDGGKSSIDGVFSAESGCFSESPLEDSPTLESLSIKRYATALHPEIPLEAFSVKKKTIAFRRISSQPLPTLRLDSPTEFLDVDKDENESDETIHNENRENILGGQKTKLFAEETCSQDSGLGLDGDRRGSVSSFDDTSSISTSTSSLNLLERLPSLQEGKILRSSVSSLDEVVSLCSSTSSLNQLDRLPSLEEVWNSQDNPDFKAPRGMPPKRHRNSLEDKQFSEDTCSPIKYSPVKLSSVTQTSFSKALFQPPEGAARSSKSSKNGSDDGFQELFEMDDLKNEAEDQVSTLISATLLHRPTEDKDKEAATDEPQPSCSKITFFVGGQKDTPSSRPAGSRPGLHRSMSLDIRRRPSFKRCEPPVDNTTPVQSKRRRGEKDNTTSSTSTLSSNNAANGGSSSDAESSDILVPHYRRLHRCHSETEAMIKSAVSRMFLEPDLIGDSSKPYCLPTVRGKHQDLKSITPDTLSRLIGDEFALEVEEFHIIDCRYPYEYEAGHIQNAVNIYTEEEVVERYLKSPLTVKDSSKRMILVFHCEFSSERGPRLFRFLRRRDRETNKECYPFLHYPEIYLLEGGYKSFFENCSQLCEPREYKTMFDKNHSDDLRKFRAKCKSWSDDKAQARSGVRNLKF